jgi:hypothetical protein
MRNIYLLSVRMVYSCDLAVDFLPGEKVYKAVLGNVPQKNNSITAFSHERIFELPPVLDNDDGPLNTFDISSFDNGNEISLKELNSLLSPVEQSVRESTMVCSLCRLPILKLTSPIDKPNMDRFAFYQPQQSPPAKELEHIKDENGVYHVECYELYKAEMDSYQPQASETIMSLMDSNIPPPLSLLDRNDPPAIVTSSKLQKPPPLPPRLKQKESHHKMGNNTKNELGIVEHYTAPINEDEDVTVDSTLTKNASAALQNQERIVADHKHDHNEKHAHEMRSPICKQCGLLIKRGNYFRALGENWHLDCFTCTVRKRHKD